LAVVDSELGAAAIPDEELWSGGRFKVFLYSAGARVVGCLLAERIEEAYVAVMQGARLGERRKAVLGICRVWTAREWRRGGIARRLVEIARERLVFGCKIPREEVAFSQPTESGARLAEAWWRGTEEEDEKKGGEGENGKGGEEGEDWLVYVERV
jgi:GNAT superfamily N-acetyltransferase